MTRRKKKDQGQAKSELTSATISAPAKSSNSPSESSKQPKPNKSKSATPRETESKGFGDYDASSTQPETPSETTNKVVEARISDVIRAVKYRNESIPDYALPEVPSILDNLTGLKNPPIIMEDYIFLASGALGSESNNVFCSWAAKFSMAPQLTLNIGNKPESFSIESMASYYNFVSRAYSLYTIVENLTNLDSFVKNNGFAESELLKLAIERGISDSLLPNTRTFSARFDRFKEQLKRLYLPPEIRKLIVRFFTPSLMSVGGYEQLFIKTVQCPSINRFGLTEVSADMVTTFSSDGRPFPSDSHWGSGDGFVMRNRTKDYLDELTQFIEDETLYGGCLEGLHSVMKLATPEFEIKGLDIVPTSGYNVETVGERISKLNQSFPSVDYHKFKIYPYVKGGDWLKFIPNYEASQMGGALVSMIPERRKVTIDDYMSTFDIIKDRDYGSSRFYTNDSFVMTSQDWLLSCFNFVIDDSSERSTQFSLIARPSHTIEPGLVIPITRKDSHVWSPVIGDRNSLVEDRVKIVSFLPDQKDWFLSYGRRKCLITTPSGSEKGTVYTPSISFTSHQKLIMWKLNFDKVFHSNNEELAKLWCSETFDNLWKVRDSSESKLRYEIVKSLEAYWK